jgi:S-phase kinase-associated protein 1
MASIITSDNVTFNLHLNLVNRCKMLNDCVEECGASAPIPIPNVDSKNMNRIIEYYTTGELSSTDNMLPLLVACDYLNYDELLDYGAKIVADSLKGKTPDEIRAFFSLPS